MMEDAATYVRMEEERDQLRLKMEEMARKCALLTIILMSFSI